jgi:hypothetical protein
MPEQPGLPARRDDGEPVMDSPFPPGISFADAFKMMTPPGAGSNALMEALKASRRPVIALPASDEDARYFSLCPRCGAVHDSRVLCANETLRAEMLSDQPPAGGCYFPLSGPDEPAGGPLPADPFTAGDLRATALSQFWHEAVEAGIPPENVDRIIGVMLAEAHGKPE